MGTSHICIVENKVDQTVKVLNIVTQILKEFKDVVFVELCKELPLRHHINHKIKLLPRT